MTLETIYDGDGSDVTFNTNFDYLEQEDISVAVKPSGGSYATKTLDTHYTVSGQVVTFTSGNVPPNNSKVRIRRHTPVTQPRHTFYAGSTVTAKSLNDNTNQILNALEERGLAVDDETDQPFTIGTHNEIKVNSATNLEVVAGKITLDKMAINSIDSDQYVDGSIDHVHLSTDAIDGDNISNDSINSEHYVDASIDHQHLSNDCIDGDNLQDDSVNSEHIAAGAVDLEHMSSQSVDEDNLFISNAGSNGDYLTKQSGNSGGLTWASLAANSGLMKQFIPGSTTTEVDMDQTLTDSGLTANITTTGSNKVLVLVQQAYQVNDDDGGFYFEMKLLRGSTSLVFRELNHDATSSGNSEKDVHCLMHLDSPGAGTHTYKMQMRGGQNNAKAQPASLRSDIFLIELAI